MRNQLTEKHIDKILTTYKNRETIDNYSYLAPISEIVVNDYNLKILKYIETRENEKNISIEKVLKESE